MVFFMPSLLTTGEPMDAAQEKTYRLRRSGDLVGRGSAGDVLASAFGVGVAGGKGPQGGVLEDGAACGSREEASSLRWVIPRFRMRSYAAEVCHESVATFNGRMKRLEAFAPVF